MHLRLVFMGTASKSEKGRKGLSWTLPSTKGMESQGLRAQCCHLAKMEGLSVTKGYNLAGFGADSL
jgi:hypothetical protein